MDSVAFVSPRYPPYIGGIETHVFELATRVRAWFRKVSVITTDPAGHLPSVEWARDGPVIYRVRAFAPHENFHFPQIHDFSRRLRQCRAQILHLHSMHDLPGPIAGFINSQDRLVFTPHFAGSIYSRLGRVFFAVYSPIIRELIHRVDAVICVSEFEASCLLRIYPESLRKIHVIRNGVDFARVIGHRWRPPSQPTVLFAGRLERHKNVDKIISAFAELRKENPDARLVIVGSGPLRDELVQLAASLGLEGKIQWVNGVDKARLYELYSSSTVVAVPSEFEAYGLVAAEAISLGVPTIVANSTALSEFVVAGLAEPIDPPITAEKLQVQIARILANPSAFSPRETSGEIILSWDQVAAKTCALYESLLQT